ncbi:MAG TPA: sigma-70 family RNA polymerase sigma factor [Clostridiaceae bacterium]|nr:sigma-70 family RNA polymerase sigma factor [Clostridiaceae bacterium]
MPEDSNAQFLPLMFFLPEELIVRCPTLMRLPRNLHIILTTQELLDIVESDQFLDDVFNATSLLAFPHFGFKGWKEDYTGYHPAWILSGAVTTWAYMLNKEVGVNMKTLLEVPITQELPFMPQEFVTRCMKLIVEKVIEDGNLQPVLDIVREMPCDEDFEKRNSNIRRDFIRKWYHTRAKGVQMISLEECMEDAEGHINEVEDIETRFEDSVLAFDFCERFKATLPDKDRAILELRIEGFTLQQIARRLGYKNHSGVLKRMLHVKNAFIEYNSKYGQ